jgi:quaternary ammonium compound-resistance protein SugE
LAFFFHPGTDDPANIKEFAMSWFILFLAGLLEVAWAVGLKQTAGFTRLWPSVFTVVAMTGSVLLLGLALRHLPLGTAYAVWTGIGTVGTAIVGMAVLGEPAGALRLLSIALIVAGIAGLKLLTPG